MFTGPWAREDAVWYVFNNIDEIGFQNQNDFFQYCESTPEDSCCNLKDINNNSTAATKSIALAIGLSVAGAVLLLIAIAYFIRYRGGFCQSSSSSENSVKTTYQVVKEYSPELIDELQLNVGNIVIIKAVFDDDWGFGLNITTESEGKFPLNCLADLNTSGSGKVNREIFPSIGTSPVANNKPEFQKFKITPYDGKAQSVLSKHSDSVILLLQRIQEICQKAMEFLKKYLDILWQHISPAVKIIKKSIADFMRYLGILWWRFSSIRLQTTYKVVQKHIPNLVDEIALNIGDIVIVKERFDDGWGAGLNITTEKEGSFPLNCISDLKTIDSHTLENGTRRSVRDSSLINNKELLLQSLKIETSVEATENAVNKPPVPPKLDNPIEVVQDIYSSIKVKPKEENKEEKPGTINYATVNSEFYDPFKGKPLKIKTNESIFGTVRPSPTTPSKGAGVKFDSSFFNPFKNTAIKSARKFGNDELKYGTAKAILGPSPTKSPTASKSPIRQTFTFNKNIK
jgi:hypothetical protein